MNSISYSLFKNESLLSILVLIFIIFLFCLLLKKLLPPFTYKRPQVDIVEYVPASSRTAYTKKDLFWILLLTGIYAVVSLYDLGHTKMPSTTWQPSSNEQQIIFELTNETDFDEVIAFYCEGDNNSNPNTYQLGIQDISISGSNDLTVWDNIVNYTDGSIYSYKITKGDYNYRYIKLECTNQNDTLTEIAFKKKDADYLLPVSIYEDNFNESSYPATLLIDEQDKVVLHPTYLDQSYFDEVYHPRNANEIADGQYMYASVHPLLGTSLIALSIKLLGWYTSSKLFYAGGGLGENGIRYKKAFLLNLRLPKLDETANSTLESYYEMLLVNNFQMETCCVILNEVENYISKLYNLSQSEIDYLLN